MVVAGEVRTTEEEGLYLHFFSKTFTLVMESLVVMKEVFNDAG